MRPILRRSILSLGLLYATSAALSSPPPGESRSTDSWLDQTRDRWTAVAQKIWETPEVALTETKSSKVLAAELEKEGFKVTWGVGGEPTAFVATAGSGKPVVGLLAEYDALPGLSQAPGVAKKQALVLNGAEPGPGHGCGHNLLGTAATAAAIAANRERIARKLPGTIQLFGTPAEEQLYGKLFMINGGAFKDTDVVLSWHPDDENRVNNRTRLALVATDVEFFGKSAHAAANPWLGRSALDALVLFDHALSLMREHIRPTGRIHRIVTGGGAAANIIPDHTKGQYWLRDGSWDSVQEMLVRMRKAADGAAMATETRAQVTVLAGTRDPVPNDALDHVVQKQLDRVGAPAFDAADVEFAKAIQKELGFEEKGLQTAVTPWHLRSGGTASSDIGEVSAVVPLAELGIAAKPIGTPGHHWAQTVCAAHPIGQKGMLVASKVLAASAVDLLADPALVKAAKDDFQKETKGAPYVSPLAPDAKPKPF
jgi:aminobenzoyl-glutamate utilization protein B